VAGCTVWHLKTVVDTGKLDRLKAIALEVPLGFAVEKGVSLSDLSDGVLFIEHHLVGRLLKVLADLLFREDVLEIVLLNCMFDGEFLE